jgi:hypothetical protein
MSGSDYNAGYEDGVRNERQAQIYTNENKKYGAEELGVINPKSIRANTPDWQEGYQQGLIKSISLIGHLQQAIVPKNARIQDLIIDRRLEWKKLEEAIELIAEEIEANNNEY